MWAKIITIKITKDLNYFSICALHLFNTRVSQFELNYWNKSTLPRHSNLFRYTCLLVLSLSLSLSLYLLSRPFYHRIGSYQSDLQIWLVLMGPRRGNKRICSTWGGALLNLWFPVVILHRCCSCVFATVCCCC